MSQDRAFATGLDIDFLSNHRILDILTRHFRRSSIKISAQSTR
jgi:hypothetical protein